MGDRAGPGRGIRRRAAVERGLRDSRRRPGRGQGDKCHCIFREETDEVILLGKSKLSVA